MVTVTSSAINFNDNTGRLQGVTVPLATCRVWLHSKVSCRRSFACACSSPCLQSVCEKRLARLAPQPKRFPNMIAKSAFEMTNQIATNEGRQTNLRKCWQRKAIPPPNNYVFLGRSVLASIWVSTLHRCGYHHFVSVHFMHQFQHQLQHHFVVTVCIKFPSIMCSGT